MKSGAQAISPNAMNAETYGRSLVGQRHAAAHRLVFAPGEQEREHAGHPAGGGDHQADVLVEEARGAELIVRDRRQAHHRGDDHRVGPQQDHVAHLRGERHEAESEQGLGLAAVEVGAADAKRRHDRPRGPPEDPGVDHLQHRAGGGDADQQRRPRQPAGLVAQSQQRRDLAEVEHRKRRRRGEQAKGQRPGGGEFRPHRPGHDPREGLRGQRDEKGQAVQGHHPAERGGRSPCPASRSARRRPPARRGQTRPPPGPRRGRTPCWPRGSRPPSPAAAKRSVTNRDTAVLRPKSSKANQPVSVPASTIIA